MHLIHLLSILQVGLAVALPKPDLSKDDSYPGNAAVLGNEAEEDMSRVMPCDEKTLKKFCNETCPKMCSLGSPKCWGCVAVCAQAQYFREIHYSHKLEKCIQKGHECKQKMEECVLVKTEGCSEKYGKCAKEGEICQAQTETLQEMGEGVVVSEETVGGKKNVTCRLL